MSREHRLSASSYDTGEGCARAQELVSYLYLEASAAEAADLEQHMRGCAACRAELAEFGEVRRSIGDWRAEALGGIAQAPAQEADFAPAYDGSKGQLVRQRSALAALREFFTLSPGWMRAATACAVLAVCALALFAVATLFAPAPPSTVADNPAAKLYTQQQVDEMLAQLKQKAEDKQPEQLSGQGQQKTEIANLAAPPRNDARRQPGRRSVAAPSPMTAKSLPAPRGSGHMSPLERQQLAEVLLSQENRDEEKLPRLSDLLDNESN